jgi:predicted aspartyl protease
VALVAQLLYSAGWAVANPGLNPSSQSTVAVLQCVRDGDSLLVPIQINGRTCLGLFDTGAENLTISRGQLQQLGLALPSVACLGWVQGVGAAPICTIKATAQVRAGNLVCDNFPLNVQEQSQLHPILGKNFFRDCLITVDPASARITVRPSQTEPLLQKVPSSVLSLTSRESVVQLDHASNQLLMPVWIDGHLVKMLFDTGADGITFSLAQARAFRISIPASAEREIHVGIAGVVEGLGFRVSHVRLGPIVKENVKISVINSPGMPYPLLGANFLKDWCYTIDTKHSIVAFSRP